MYRGRDPDPARVMKMPPGTGRGERPLRVSPHDRVLWCAQPDLVTNQNRKMNDGSSVSSTPDMPWPYTAVFCPTHDGMNGTSFAAMSCSCPKIFSRLAVSLVPCSLATSLFA